MDLRSAIMRGRYVLYLLNRAAFVGKCDKRDEGHALVLVVWIDLFSGCMKLLSKDTSRMIFLTKKHADKM